MKTWATQWWNHTRAVLWLSTMIARWPVHPLAKTAVHCISKAPPLARWAISRSPDLSLITTRVGRVRSNCQIGFWSWQRTSPRKTTTRLIPQPIKVSSRNSQWMTSTPSLTTPLTTSFSKTQQLYSRILRVSLRSVGADLTVNYHLRAFNLLLTTRKLTSRLSNRMP